MAANIPEFIDPMECPLRSPRRILGDLGYTPMAPHELDDRQFTGRLWELLYAAAARRFFFCFSNHLSDREFYVSLWEQWLDQPTADIPAEAETNTTTFVFDLNTSTMTHEEIWLRYYADDADRSCCQTTDPNCAIPPHSELPYDRDRFLPTPPIPLEAHTGWLPGDDDSPDEDELDPLGLAEVDREIAESKTPVDSDNHRTDPPDSALETQLNALEPENWLPPAQQLEDANVPLLPPAEITAETLAPILWELFHNLSLRGFYILHTDHLSDEKLYAELWERGLRDPAQLPGRNPRGGWFHDFLGSWGDDEMQIWLRYYATDAERVKHSAECPKDILPPKIKRPFNRDWRLPKGPF